MFAECHFQIQYELPTFSNVDDSNRADIFLAHNTLILILFYIMVEITIFSNSLEFESISHTGLHEHGTAELVSQT